MQRWIGRLDTGQKYLVFQFKDVYRPRWAYTSAQRVSTWGKLLQSWPIILNWSSSLPNNPLVWIVRSPVREYGGIPSTVKFTSWCFKAQLNTVKYEVDCSYCTDTCARKFQALFSRIIDQVMLPPTMWNFLKGGGETKKRYCPYREKRTREDLCASKYKPCRTRKVHDCSKSQRSSQKYWLLFQGRYCPSTSTQYIDYKLEFHEGWV